MEIVLSIVSVVMLGSVFFLMKKNSKLVDENIQLKTKNAQTDLIEKQCQEAHQKIESLLLEKESLVKLNQELSTKNDEAEKHFNERVADFEKQKVDFSEQMKIQMQNLSNDILKKQSEEFKNTQKESMDILLNPFKDKLDGFSKNVKDFSEQQKHSEGELKNQLDHLLDMNTKLGTEAKELSKALRGDSKFQGDWGEEQLERLFEVVGLKKDIDYTAQSSFKNENEDLKNERLRPDFIVKMPDNKNMIVDCKMSLKAYTNYINEEDPQKRSEYLKEHIKSVKGHIDEMARKDYQNNIKDGNYFEYACMFIPVEGAYLSAVHEDMTLLTYASDRHIALTTPSSLIPILRTVYHIWSIQKQNENISKIMDECAAMYDKFAGFSEDMEKIGKSITGAQKSYEDALKKLKSGKGNVISRLDKLKEYGVKPSKNLNITSEEYISIEDHSDDDK